MMSKEEFDRVYGAAWHVNAKEIRDRVTFITNAGDPSGSVEPTHVGQTCLDTVNDDFYIAVGVTDTDWKQITA